jgi:hypothetical protein
VQPAVFAQPSPTLAHAGARSDSTRGIWGAIGISCLLHALLLAQLVAWFKAAGSVPAGGATLVVELAKPQLRSREDARQRTAADPPATPPAAASETANLAAEAVPRARAPSRSDVTVANPPATEVRAALPPSAPEPAPALAVRPVRAGLPGPITPPAPREDAPDQRLDRARCSNPVWSDRAESPCLTAPRSTCSNVRRRFRCRRCRVSIGSS